jgi:hypothetical protein
MQISECESIVLWCLGCGPPSPSTLGNGITYVFEEHSLKVLLLIAKSIAWVLSIWFLLGEFYILHLLDVGSMELYLFQFVFPWFNLHALKQGGNPLWHLGFCSHHGGFTLLTNILSHSFIKWVLKL